MSERQQEAEALRRQQQALQAAIGDGAAPGGRLLKPPADIGLAVYRSAYPARLGAALRDNYTVLQRALGDAGFEALARAYLAARPSAHASIRWFGDRLAEFMAGADYAACLPHRSLIDFARMDWALRSAFDAADAPPLNAEALKNVAPQEWAGLVFRLHPSVHLQALDWAIEPAWRALRAWEPASPEPAPELDAPLAAPHCLLVWRDGLETRWRSLEPLEAALLQAVGEQRMFADICALAAQTLGEADAPAAVVQMLQRWLAEGLLIAS